MGRTFVTFEEASLLLKCTRRTIHNYVKRGLLRRGYENGKIVLYKDEVEQLIDQNGLNIPPINNHTLLELLSRIHTLEVQMAVFRKMNGIDVSPPLRPSPEEAKQLLTNAKEYLQRTSFKEEEIILWISMFNRMDEVSFELFRKSVEDNDFWQDIFSLCLHLMKFVSDPKRNSNSRSWYQRHLELNECRKSLRSIVLVWVELGLGKASVTLRKALNGEKDELVRRLTA